MAEQKPIPITESEYRIIEQAVRRSPNAKNLSEERVQDLILAEVQRTVESRQSTVGPGARPWTQQIFRAFVPEGRPQRVLTQEEARTVMADAEANAPPGLSVQELMNLKVRAVEQAAYEGTPTGPTMRALQKLEPVVTPLLPENPVDLLDLLPGNQKQAYRDWQQRMLAKGKEELSPYWQGVGERLLMRDRPYPPGPGDVLPILDFYNLARMHSDPATIATSGLPVIKGVRALFKGGKAATAEQAALRVRRAGGPPDVTPGGGGMVEEAVEAATTPRTPIRYRVEGPRARDLPRQDVPWEPTQDLGQAAEEAEAAVRARDVPWTSDPEDLGRAADEAEAAVRARDVPWGARAVPEAPERSLAGAVEETLPQTLREAPASVEGPPVASSEGAAALPDDLARKTALMEEVDRLHAELGHPWGDRDDFSGFIETDPADLNEMAIRSVLKELQALKKPRVAGLPEGIEEVIKTRTRPGSPHGHTTRVAGFNAPGERLPQISQTEADRLGARIKAIRTEHEARRADQGFQFEPQRVTDEPRAYTDPDDLTMGMDFGLGRALDQITPVKVGAIGGGSLGGLYGASQDKENPLRGLAVGTAVGTVGGAVLGQLPKEARLIKADPFGWYDKMRRAGYLVGWAVPKSAAGAVTAPGWALAEQTFAGHPLEAGKNLLRGLKSIPEGFREAKKVVETGHAPAYAEMAATHAPPAEGLASIPGRTMGVFDAFGRQALLHMKNPATGAYYTPEEAAAFLLSSKGRSSLGKGWIDFLAGRSGDPNISKTGRFLKHTEFPVGAGTSVNSIEQGLMRTPGVNLFTSNKLPWMQGSEMAQTGREIGARTALGAGAFLAGEEAENRIDPESYQMRRLMQAAFGPYGLPFSFGMASQRNKELDEERRRSPWEVLGETTFQEAAGPPFRRNPLTEYVESTPPGRIWEGLFTPKY